MKVVAIREVASGNESVGTAWAETAVFDGATPLFEVIQWAENASKRYGGGRLMLSVPTNTDEQEALCSRQ